MTLNYSLGTQHLENLFPFFFALDRNLQIVKKGISLKKISANESSFKNQFSYQRPFFGITYEFDSILKFQGQVFVLNLLGNDKKIRIKGQFVFDEISDLLYFWGSPYINSEKDFENTGLQIKDYAIFDWNISFLQVNKSLELEREDKTKLKYQFEKQKNFRRLSICNCR